MQPEEALASIERTIRKAIRLLLPDWRTRISQRDLRAAESALANEASNRRGVQVSGDLLDFLYTRPAFELVRGQWEYFEPMLGNRARIEALLLFVEDVRNSVAHGRELVSYERDLVSGVAGYLSNLVAIWETQSHALAANYPVITTVRDSFGREGSPEEWANLDIIRVDVGDFIEFTAQATEARGQGVIWLGMFASSRRDLDLQALTLRHWPQGQGPVRARGASVRFRVRITEHDVGEMKRIWVGVTSNSRYHRHGGLDDFRAFGFAVNPPRGT